jgi:phospholipid/cholesterol/gamma-HCH transport system permease protein
LENKPVLVRSVEGDRLMLSAGGEWTAVHAHELEAAVESIEREAGGARALSLDLQRIAALDTFGAWLIERLIRTWQSGEHDARLLGAPEHCRELLAKVHGASRQAPSVRTDESRLLSALAQIGRSAVGLGRELIPFLNMLGALGAALARTLARPAAFRLTSAVHSFSTAFAWVR